MQQVWPELCMYMHLIYTYKHPNKSIIKKADHPKIRFTIKQHRNHLTTTGCVMQSIPNVPGRSNASAKKLGPAGSSLDLSSACIYALCSQCNTHLGFASMQRRFVSRRISWKAHRAKRIGLNPRHYSNPHADQALTKMDSSRWRYKDKLTSSYLG